MSGFIPPNLVPINGNSPTPPKKDNPEAARASMSSSKSQRSFSSLFGRSRGSKSSSIECPLGMGEILVTTEVTVNSEPNPYYNQRIDILDALDTPVPNFVPGGLGTHSCEITGGPYVPPPPNSSSWGPTHRPGLSTQDNSSYTTSEYSQPENPIIEDFEHKVPDTDENGNYWNPEIRKLFLAPKLPSEETWLRGKASQAHLAKSDGRKDESKGKGRSEEKRSKEEIPTRRSGGKKVESESEDESGEELIRELNAYAPATRPRQNKIRHQRSLVRVTNWTPFDVVENRDEEDQQGRIAKEASTFTPPGNLPLRELPLKIARRDAVATRQNEPEVMAIFAASGSHGTSNDDRQGQVAKEGGIYDVLKDPPPKNHKVDATIIGRDKHSVVTGATAIGEHTSSNVDFQRRVPEESSMLAPQRNPLPREAFDRGLRRDAIVNERYELGVVAGVATDNDPQRNTEESENPATRRDISVKDHRKTSRRKSSIIDGEFRPGPPNRTYPEPQLQRRRNRPGASNAGFSRANDGYYQQPVIEEEPMHPSPPKNDGRIAASAECQSAPLTHGNREHEAGTSSVTPDSSRYTKKVLTSDDYHTRRSASAPIWNNTGNNDTESSMLISSPKRSHDILASEKKSSASVAEPVWSIKKKNYETGVEFSQLVPLLEADDHETLISEVYQNRLPSRIFEEYEAGPATEKQNKERVPPRRNINQRPDVDSEFRSGLPKPTTRYAPRIQNKDKKEIEIKGYTMDSRGYTNLTPPMSRSQKLEEYRPSPSTGRSTPRTFENKEDKQNNQSNNGLRIPPLRLMKSAQEVLQSRPKSRSASRAAWNRESNNSPNMQRQMPAREESSSMLASRSGSRAAWNRERSNTPDTQQQTFVHEESANTSTDRSVSRAGWLREQSSTPNMRRQMPTREEMPGTSTGRSVSRLAWNWEQNNTTNTQRQTNVFQKLRPGVATPMFGWTGEASDAKDKANKRSAPRQTLALKRSQPSMSTNRSVSRGDQRYTPSLEEPQPSGKYVSKLTPPLKYPEITPPLNYPQRPRQRPPPVFNPKKEGGNGDGKSNSRGLGINLDGPSDDFWLSAVSPNKAEAREKLRSRMSRSVSLPSCPGSDSPSHSYSGPVEAQLEESATGAELRSPTPSLCASRSASPAAGRVVDSVVLIDRLLKEHYFANAKSAVRASSYSSSPRSVSAGRFPVRPNDSPSLNLDSLRREPTVPYHSRPPASVYNRASFGKSLNSQILRVDNGATKVVLQNYRILSGSKDLEASSHSPSTLVGSGYGHLIYSVPADASPKLIDRESRKAIKTPRIDSVLYFNTAELESIAKVIETANLTNTCPGGHENCTECTNLKYSILETQIMPTTMAPEERQKVIQNNRSLRTIKTELENLLGNGAVDDATFDAIMAALPNEKSPNASSGATALSRASTTSTAPTAALSNLSLNKDSPSSPNPSVPSLPSRSPSVAAPPRELFRATAIYRYAGPDPGDCQFNHGDEIAVYEKTNDDWWRGKNLSTGQEGLFPVNYVQPRNENASPYGGYDNEKAPPYNGYNGGYPGQYQQGPYQQGPPPPGPSSPYNSAIPPMAVAQQTPDGNPGKPSMARKIGGKLGNAAIFGAGATIGADMVNAIL